MQLTNELTPTQRAAIVVCLRIAAARGRELREERERIGRDAEPERNESEARKDER